MNDILQLAFRELIRRGECMPHTVNVPQRNGTFKKFTFYKIMDKQLIERAIQTPCTRWGEIDILIAQAKDEITKNQLKRIRNSKYHQEEMLT